MIKSLKSLRPRYKKYKRRDNTYWGRRRLIQATWNKRNIELWNNIEWRKSRVKGTPSWSNSWKRKFKLKQDLKSYYGGLSESTFQKINRKNRWNQVQLTSRLETRLDMIIFRSNWAYSIYSAKQLIHQGHFMVNGIITRTASYMVSPKDCIEIIWNKNSRKLIKKILIVKLKTIFKHYFKLIYRVPHYRGGRPSLKKWVRYWLITPLNFEVDYRIMAIYYIEDTPQEYFHLYYPLTNVRYFQMS
jgi:ribosomal protein S4